MGVKPLGYTMPCLSCKILIQGSANRSHWVLVACPCCHQQQKCCPRACILPELGSISFYSAKANLCRSLDGSLADNEARLLANSFMQSRFLKTVYNQKFNHHWVEQSSAKTSKSVRPQHGHFGICGSKIHCYN